MGENKIIYLKRFEHVVVIRMLWVMTQLSGLGLQARLFFVMSSIHLRDTHIACAVN